MALTQKTQQDYNKFINPDTPLITTPDSKPTNPGDMSRRELSKNIRQARQEVKGYDPSDISEESQTASSKLQALQQQKGEMLGWSEKKKVKKGIIDDPTAEIPTGWSAVWEKGRYVGAEEDKTKPGKDKISFTRKTKPDSQYKTTSGIGQFQSPAYTGAGSRKALKAKAKEWGVNPKQSNKKLREDLMAQEASHKKGARKSYSQQEIANQSGDLFGGGLNR